MNETSTEAPRILFVDDDRDMCELTAAALGRRGFSVSFACSTQDALSALEERAFDAVVTDISLGDGDGLVLCETILRARPALAVLVVSGSRDSAEAARAAGARLFLCKPVRMSELAEHLRAALDA